ncbi:MAG: hypothetical protein WCO04_15050, partial [Pseudomonadota bacterium]
MAFLVLSLCVASFPSGNPANLFRGSAVTAEIVLMRAADSVLSHLPSIVQRHIDIAQLESFFDADEVKRPDNPGGWAHYRAMQMSSDTKGTIAPDGLMKANSKRRAIVAKFAAAASPSQRAGITPDQWTWIGPGNQG